MTELASQHHSAHELLDKRVKEGCLEKQDKHGSHKRDSSPESVQNLSNNFLKQSANHSGKSLINLQKIIFIGHKVTPREVITIINKDNIIYISTFRDNWSTTPTSEYISSKGEVI